MGNNLFYKALATISTVGIIALAGNSFVRTGSEKGNDIDEALANTRRELTQARQDALAEVKEVRKEILNEIKTARKDALDAMKKTGGKTKTAYLIFRWNNTINTIPMQSIDQCEEAALTYMSSKRLTQNSSNIRTYECVEAR